MRLKDKEGYTLIELLVAIAIIGILVVLLMRVISNAMAGRRNSERENDLKAVAMALDNYYANKKAYPIHSGETVKDLISTTEFGPYITGGIDGTDPSGEDDRMCYASAGQTYKLAFMPEPLPKVGCNNFDPDDNWRNFSNK